MSKLHQIKILTKLARPKFQAKLLAEDGRIYFIHRKSQLCGLARYLGFRRESVLNPNAPRCEHKFARHGRGCPDCGLPAGIFVKAAREWLDHMDGALVDDPGYFETVRPDYTAIPGQAWRVTLSPSELLLVESYDSTCYLTEKQFKKVRRLKEIVERVAKKTARLLECEAEEQPNDCCVPPRRFLTLVIEELKKYASP